MNIGFDLDKIFIDHPPFISDNLVDKLYKKQNKPELIYRIPSLPEQFLRKITHHPMLRKTLKENLHILQQITKEKKHTYYLISGRFNFLKTATQKVIKENHLDTLFKSMHFNFDNRQPHLFKDEMIKKLKLDKFVDDDIDLLTYLAKHNPNTIFYWLNEKLDTKIEQNLFAITHLKKIF